MAGKLECPLDNPARGIPAPYDLAEGGCADHGDNMLLEILLQLLGGEVHAVTHLLVVRVVLLGGWRAPHSGSRLITHKYRGSQQFSRVEYSTQIY